MSLEQINCRLVRALGDKASTKIRLSPFIVMALSSQLLACSLQDRLLRGVNGNDRAWPEDSRGPYEVPWNGLAPVLLERADSDCTLDKAREQLGHVQVWLKRGSKVELSTVDLSGVSGKGLRSSESRGVFYGFHSVSQYSSCQLISRNRYRCEAVQVATKSPGALIPICRANGGYPRDSLENAALAVVAAVKQSAGFLQDVPTYSRGAQAEILLLPKIEDQISTSDGPIESSFALDNAFWTVRLGQGGKRSYTIAALPHSQLRSRSQSHTYFWEQTPILSHEYGHHVFNHYMPSYFASGHSAQALGLALHNVQPVYEREVRTRHVVDAINEGFADLLSHYSHNSGLDRGGKIELGQARKARDIDQCVCDDGQGKALSRSVLKHFFSHKHSSPDNPLTPNHQDVHTIGAVIAHGLDSLYALKFSESASRKSSREKAQLLLAWAESMNKQHGPFVHLSLEDALRAMVYEGVRLAADRSGALSLAQCEVLERVFPEYSRQWAREHPGLGCQP